MGTPKNKAACALATQELNALLDIHTANRQAAWYHRLISCLPHSVFTSSEPEIIFNPAGLTYYNLKLAETTSESGRATTIYTIPELIDTFLINEGVGIAIDAHKPQRAIDLSYGEVLGFHLHRSFAEPRQHLFKTDKPRLRFTRENKDVVIREVPAQILPATSINLLKAIFQHFGLSDPRIKLAYLPETEQHELVFSIDTSELEALKTQALIQKIGWFLPRYYSYSIDSVNN